MPDPARILPFRLKPGSEGKMFNSNIHINNLGFRGKEITRDKGDAYRIIILGESTTFGATINKEDRPWPEVLEEMIRERLKLRRPVEVINAGVPAYTLLDSLNRLSSDIFPIHPDLLICYHGYNGFFLLHEGSLHHPEQPPAFIERPVKLLANIEYNLKMAAFKRRMAHKSEKKFSGESVLNTPYARAYEELIQAAGSNHVRLAIADFSMAVTPDSSTDVIEFYRAGFPAVFWEMQANRMHTDLVRELARKHPEIILVDMHPGLDGEHEKFVDLVHLTQDGRQQAAENAFAALKPVLEHDLK
jgi:lysophospholipase L1-like esterase